MIKNTFYIIFNLIYQLGSFFFFLYANTYLNEALVPKSLMWNIILPQIRTTGLVNYFRNLTISNEKANTQKIRSGLQSQSCS